MKACLAVITATGSSNGSNNTNKETRSSSGSADRSASGRFTTGDTDDTVTVRPGRRSTTSTDDPAVTPAVVDAASAGGSGSVDDEWSRQMDELDRLRPVVTFHDADDRLVVDSFTDLPDVIIDDEDEDDDVDDHAVSVKQTTVQQVITSYLVKTSKTAVNCPSVRAVSTF